MKVRLVSHASVIIYTPLGGIWCDPWLSGKAFNDSWTMRPDPVFSPDLLAQIRYLWISHEHPDHFSVPTLRGLDEAFKKRVSVLFQKRNSDKVFKALQAWGYRNFLELPNRKDVSLEHGVALNCYQVGLLDSVLTIRKNGTSIINLNDADLATGDLGYLKKIAGRPKLILNQFSIAGYDGYRDRDSALARAAAQKIESMLAVHHALQAEATLPFASFVYFSSIDNKFMNRHANSMQTVQHAFDAAGLKTIVLQPGDEHTLGDSWDNAPALAALQRLHESVDQAPYDVPALIPIDDVKHAFAEFCRMLAQRYPGLLIRRIGTLNFYLPDHGLIARCDFVAQTFETLAHGVEQADIEVYSQPLHYGFNTPFGFQTLAVSGRFHVWRNRPRWRMLKTLSILNNQEVYLRMPHALEKHTLGYLAGRARSGLWRQLLRRQQLRKKVDPGLPPASD